jgi:uncharacterized membrane protein
MNLRRTSISLSSCLAAATLLLPCAASAQSAGNAPEQSLEAQIVSIQPTMCGSDNHACQALTLRGLTAPFLGKEIHTTLDPNDFQSGHAADLKPGDKLVVDSQMVNGQTNYIVSDLVRRPILNWLLLLFCVCLLLVGGFGAIRSLLGMAVSFLILFFAIFPLILAGWPPLLVSFAGSVAIMASTFTITHGWNPKMWSALLGTCLSLVLTVALAIGFTGWARIWGLADENNVFLLDSLPHLDTRGLLLAGVIIGTLGSLNDVTISQASAVFELKSANPAMTRRQLYQSALRIGRDHISGAINTLVLAYAGASLSLLLLLASSSNTESWSILINRETFATEIVRTLVGSIGLLLAIPFTNFFASSFAARLSPSILKRMPASHSHPH